MGETVLYTRGKLKSGQRINEFTRSEEELAAVIALWGVNYKKAIEETTFTGSEIRARTFFILTTAVLAKGITMY